MAGKVYAEESVVGPVDNLATEGTVADESGASLSHATNQPTNQPRCRELAVIKGIATRSKDATSSSWPYYQ